MHVVDQVLESWRKQGIQLNTGASGQAILRLEAALGVTLPSDVRHFYATANGMQADATDEHLAFFWPVEAVISEAGAADWGDHEFGFAYVLLRSWRFIFRPTDAGLHVLSENVAPGLPPRDLGPFSEFLRVYLAAPETLHL